MYRGTTPTLYLELETELDLSNISEMWVTIKGSATEITKRYNEIVFDNETKVITVTFTQEETLKLYKGKSEIQVRIRTADGFAYATDIADVEIERILKDGVI